MMASTCPPILFARLAGAEEDRHVELKEEAVPVRLHPSSAR